MRIRIRRFQAADLRSILRLERAAFHRDAWDPALFEWYAGNWPALFLVAMVDGRLAGYCVVRPGRGAATADLDSIAVFGRHRRHGVGSALLASAGARLRRLGIQTLALMVRRDNAGAIAFYKRHGFRRIRTIPGYYEDGVAAWRMRR